MRREDALLLSAPLCGRLISLPSFLPPCGDLVSPGLLLVGAAVSTVTDAGDKASNPFSFQGRQSRLDSPALFSMNISHSACHYFYKMYFILSPALTCLCFFFVLSLSLLLVQEQLCL